MTIDIDTSLADVVRERPGLARELERLRLDYCCDGARTIAQACADAGLDEQVVVAQLADAGDDAEPEPWTEYGIAQLADHIERVHHRYFWDELPRLGDLLDTVVTVHADRHAELVLVWDLFTLLRADLEPHLRKEEQVLFPMVRELAVAERVPTFHCGSIANPITVMTREHDMMGNLLARVRHVARDYVVPDDGCESYRQCFEGLAALEADTHLHVHKENHVLFPAVARRERDLAARAAQR